MKSAIRGFIIPLALLLASHLRAQGFPKSRGLALSLDPPRLELKAKAGQETTASAVLRNDGVSRVRVRVYAEAFQLDTEGAVVSGRTSSGKRDATRWVRVNPSEAAIAEGEEQVIRITVTPPSEAQGTFWTSLFAETLPVGTAGGPHPEPVTLGVRLGSFVYVSVGAIAKPAAELKLQARRHPQDEVRAEAEIRHQSGGILRLSARWRVRDERGALLSEETAEFALFPEATRILRWKRGGIAERARRIEISVEGSGISARREVLLEADKSPP